MVLNLIEEHMVELRESMETLNLQEDTLQITEGSRRFQLASNS